MTDLLLLIAGLVAVATLVRRQRALEREVAALHDRLIRLDHGVTEPVAAPSQAQPAPVIVTEAPAALEPSPEIPPLAPEPEPLVTPPSPEAPRPGFETLVGGRLPIWVGGAALVLAGFFLVRYSIESGLLGPGVRTFLAALFSAALIAASEAARIWRPLRADPRVGQALAGAGVASAYGTLYIAAAQYHLVGPLAGFAIMLAITAGALFLALRHGPPTAIMALAGGFAAPLVAGFEAAGVGPLLTYLAIFIAALFGLSIRRGWSWLALASVVAGFGWANLILLLLDGRDAALVAGFAVILAIGAALALPRTGETRPLFRVAPLIAGFLQLLVLVPTLDFSSIAWVFYLVLGAAALFLAWRDATLMPAAIAAPVLVIVLLGGAFSPGPPAPAAPAAALLATLLFAGVGSALSRRGNGWATIALVGAAGPVLVAHGLAAALLARPLWSLLELAAAAAIASIALRHRDRSGANDTGLIEGSTAAASLTALGFATLLPTAWIALPLSAAMVVLGVWARRFDDSRLVTRPAILFLLLVATALPALNGVAHALLASLGGEPLTYPLLPPAADAIRALAIPAIATFGLLTLPTSFGRHRAPVTAVAAALALAAAYVLAKQPLAIATPERFTALGFIERAAITLAILAAGWALARRAAYHRIGTALVVLALLRILWLDLAVLNPVQVAQAVGAIPVLNAAVLLPALTALALITLPAKRPWRPLALVFAALAAAAAVRQIAHGTILTGPIEGNETWGYSAAFLALAVAWLWRGIATTSRTLRIAGLALLTLVTLKVFLLDIAALGGVLRILSFLGLGLALIGIGWAYGRVLAPKAQPSP